MVKKAYIDKQFSYGLIFMDCSMPIMNGYDASDRIRNFVKTKNLL
jgi:CheY-like chemotaxis protein